MPASPAQQVIMLERTLRKSLTRHISHSMREGTILFTDIEGSTSYWEKHGNIKGRLMVDKHNRTVFPIIRHYDGTVVKTIGDAVMARFSEPEDALKAAIGIQQGLAQLRRHDRSFRLRVRIGLHTGKLIIENNDVFGDAVNVAARVESEGSGNSILLTSSVAGKINKKHYHLLAKGKFQPRGKERSFALYSSRWEKCPNFIEGVHFTSFLPMAQRQKLESAVYALASVAVVYVLYTHYLRYLISDSERWALIALNPLGVIANSMFLSGGAFLVVLLLVGGLAAIRSLPHWLLRVFKGGFGFGLVFGLGLLVTPLLDRGADMPWNRILYESQHLFVEVLAPNAEVSAEPESAGEPLQRVERSDLLLLTDVAHKNGATWNKVLVGEQQYGWVPRIQPARIGEPERKVTMAYKFYFRTRDTWLLLAGGLGLLWGFFNFRLKPI